jgi:hypothetical protein
MPSALASPPVPLLYHGTTSARARSILKGGFRRAKSASYTGTAVNLTGSPCLAWEYGPDVGGKILEVTLSPDTRWSEDSSHGDSQDERFARGDIDALRSFGGNIWLLCNMAPSLVRVRVLPLSEIMTLVVAEWCQDGPQMGYNGDMGPMADLFWKGEEALRAELRICAGPDFDREAWKNRKITKYTKLLALAGVKPGDGSLLSPHPSA